MLSSTLRLVLTLVILASTIAFPFVMQSLDLLYYVSFASRVLIYALAATSLNLILGYGGMVSFGHAAFVGAGAYTAAIMIVEGAPSRSEEHTSDSSHLDLSRMPSSA